MAKAHLALFMAAIAEAAGEQGHLFSARADKTPEKMTSEPAGGTVVDADITNTRHVGDVRDHGDDGDAARRDGTDRLTHHRVIDGDDADAVGLGTELGEPSRQ